MSIIGGIVVLYKFITSRQLFILLNYFIFFHLTSKTAEEYQKIRGFKPRNHTNMQADAESNDFQTSRALPVSIDWRARGYVTPIKDQVLHQK